MTWREDLVGQEVLVLDGFLVGGTVTKVWEPNTFLRADAEEGELPVSEHVIQLDNGHAFLAKDEQRNSFYALTPQDKFVLDAMREDLKAAIQSGFRVAVASGMSPDKALTLTLSALAEAERALQQEDE